MIGDFSIRNVDSALQFDFLVGWTKEVAVSSHMVKQIKNNMNASFLQASKETVANLVKALEVGQEETIIDLLEQCQPTFRRLEFRYLHTFAQTTKKMPAKT